MASTRSVRKPSSIPANETPEARFARVATIKVNSLIRNFRSLARLTGKKAKSSDVQRKAIKDALQAAFNDSMESLEGKKTTASGFKL